MKLNKLSFLFYSFLLLTMSIMVSCEDESATEYKTASNFVSFVEMPRVIGIGSGETENIEAKVLASQATNADRVIGLRVLYAEDTAAVSDTTSANPDYFSVPASVTIPAGSKEGTFQVSVTGTDLGAGARIVIEMVPTEGVDMAMTYGGSLIDPANPFEARADRLRINVKEEFLCNENHFSVEILTDGYGTETSWELYDADLNLIYNGGPYADVVGDGEIRDLCLPDGHYTFIAYDSFGDGMFDGTNQGYYKLSKYDAEGAATVIAQNGTFAADDIVEFDLP